MEILFCYFCGQKTQIESVSGMKKLWISIVLAIFAALSLRAAETASHSNRLYFTIDLNANPEQVPVTLYLENPTIGLTAVEAYFSLPQDVTVTSSQLGARCASTHKVTAGDTFDGYYVSVASEDLENFADTDGAVCTLICDFSMLQDGDYNISASGVFAVGVSNEVITSYTAAMQSENFTINGGAISGIATILSDTPTGELEIYNLHGVKLKEPQRGQINIINGKKVIR